MSELGENVTQGPGNNLTATDVFVAKAQADRVSVKYDLRGLIIEHWEDPDLEIWVTRN